MIKKLKVGLFIDTYFPMVDGVIVVTDNYARRLAKFCDVTVFCPEGRKSFDDSTLPYKVVRCTKKFKLSFLDYDLPLPKRDKKFKEELENSNLDIVHIHSPFSIGKMGIKYAKKHNIPCVGHMHSQFKQDFKKAVKLNGLTNIMVKIVMSAFNKCDECWAVNEMTSQIFVGYGAKQPPKVHYNGTDMLPIENNHVVEELKAKYDIKNDEKVFMFVGRITTLKNIFFILDVLKELNSRGFKFKMLYVGSGPDEEKLKKDIEEAKLEKEAIMVGRITDRELLANYFKLSDLFLFPSIYDTNGLVQIEAASQKTPTIFLEGTAASSATKDNVNGYHAKNNVKEFADKIVEIFADESKYQAVCENAYKDIYHTWDDIVMEGYNRYLELIEEKKKQKVSKK